MGVLYCLWSDWHIGQTISQEETQENEFSIATARKRIDKLVNATKEAIKNVKPKLVYVLGLGDYLSGTIHQELVAGNELGAMEQVETAGHLIASAYYSIARGSKVPVRFCGLATDNHGRLTKKPQYKGRYNTNLSYLTLAFAQSLLDEKLKKNFEIVKSISHLLVEDGCKILLTHGDQVKSYNGFPFYGINMYRSRELLRRAMLNGSGFDLLFMGHFHTTTLLGESIVVNGSLCGTSEFDAARGYFSLPSQSIVLVEGKRITQLHIVPLS